MGVIIRERVIKEVDLFNYNAELYECTNCGIRIERHILQEGVRYHILSYGAEMICSKENCEINHKCKKDLSKNI